MIRMHRFYQISALMLFFFIASGVAPAQEKAGEIDSKIVADMDKLLSKNYSSDSPGAAVIIVKDGKTIFRKGYGLADLEKNIPITPEMVFRLGSVTKQFTATAIMMLAEQGKLSVKDDITKYLINFPTGGKKITVE